MVFTENEAEIRGRIAELQTELRKKDVDTLSADAHVGYDAGPKMLFFLSLGKEMLITVPEYEVQKTEDPQRMLTYLEYLNRAANVRIANEDLSVSEFFDDDAKAEEADQWMEDTFDALFAGQSAELFRKACRKLGGTLYESDADVTATFWYMPMLPITINFWEETEETMASGDIQADETAGKILPAEELCRIGSVLVKRIAEVMDNLKNQKKG